MVAELYDALREAGASDEKARRAAEALANYDDRFNRLGRQIGDLDGKIDRVFVGLDHKIDQVDSKIGQVAGRLDSKIDQLAGRLDSKIDQVAGKLDSKIDQAVAVLERKLDASKAEQNLLRWMSGTSLALSLAILVKLFIH